MRKTTLILTLAATTSACYQYYSVEEAAPLPEPGTEVRIVLTSPQPLDLGSMTINDVSMVEGDVYEIEGDTLGLFSRRLRTYYGFSERTDGAVFYFDRSQFGRLEQRQLVPWKTGIAIGAISAGVLATMYLALDLGGGSEGNGTVIPPQPSRAPGIPLNWIVR